MQTNKGRLTELARLFLKLGLIGFGGPAVHIAMMRAETVVKRKWFTDSYFLDLVGATNLIPGPNSTEMAMHCGQERAGWKGLVVAGVCFILPAVVITCVFAWAYRRYGHLPEVAPFIYGIKPAIIAVVVSAMIPLGRKALKSVLLGLLGGAAAVLALLGFNEVLVLFGIGLLGAFIQSARGPGGTLLSIAPLALAILPQRFPWAIFWVFLKVGAILYGSGYVLFAFLDTELVARGLLSRQQLFDAIAVGQFTPGPVFSAASFIGWQLGGIGGAAAATVGIFLPSFLFVALLRKFIPLLRKSRPMSAFLDTVNIVSVALVLVVCGQMAREAIADWRTVVIAILGLGVSLRFPGLNSAFVVLGGALLGYLLFLLSGNLSA